MAHGLGFEEAALYTFLFQKSLRLFQVIPNRCWLVDYYYNYIFTYLLFHFDCCISMAHTSQSNTVLSVPQVLDIFKLKTDKHARFTGPNGVLSAKLVGQYYNVSTKTVRDIWNSRTWYRETHHLEPSRSDAKERLSKRPGRPKGSKDRKPRVRKMFSLSSHADFVDPGQLQPVNMGIINDLASQQNIVYESCSAVSWTNATSNPRTDDSAPSWAAIVDACAAGPNFGDPFHDDWKHWTCD